MERSSGTENVRCRIPRLLVVSALVVLAAMLDGCFLFAPTRNPIRTSVRAAAAGRAARCLVVMLPGFGDSDRSFESHGFVRAAASNGVGADVIAVDAHYKYYKRRTVVERVHRDVLAPARSRGYQRIVLLGISMGGLGAVALAREHPEDVDALVLLAPYLGDDELAAQVRTEGLARFTPRNPSDFFERNWAFLGGYARAEARPTILLGYGERDRLAPTLELLRTHLPPDRVSVVGGGHGWDTWTPIFERWVADGHLAHLCGPAAGQPAD